MAYNQNEPRDKSGKWTIGGSVAINPIGDRKLYKGSVKIAHKKVLKSKGVVKDSSDFRSSSAEKKSLRDESVRYLKTEKDYDAWQKKAIKHERTGRLKPITSRADKILAAIEKV